LANDATTILTFISPNVAVTENLTIVLNVNDGASTQKSVTIQIKEINRAQNVAIKSYNAMASVGIKVDLSANVTDEDIASIAYLRKQIKGPELVLSDTRISTLNFVVPEFEIPAELFYLYN
jgi:hypothetical protein